MIARHSIWEHLREVTPAIGAPPAKQKMWDQLCAHTVYDRKQALHSGQTAQSDQAGNNLLCLTSLRKGPDQLRFPAPWRALQSLQSVGGSVLSTRCFTGFRVRR